MNGQIVHKEITTDLEINGEYYDVAFDRESTIVKDGSYGADADGRRGTAAYFVDDDRFTNLWVNSKPIAEYPKAFQEAVERAVRAWMNKNSVDF